MKIIKNIVILISILLIWSLCVILAFLFSVKISIDKGITNAESIEDDKIDNVKIEEQKSLISASNREVHKFIDENPILQEKIEKAYGYFNWTQWRAKWFPKNMVSDPAFQFILKWISKRKKFYDAIYEESRKYWVDWDLVLASILPEQIRIATKSSRDSIKKAVLYWTPTLFLSDNISLWIIGMKVNTAKQVLSDARLYWIYTWYRPSNLQDTLMNDEVWQARLAVLIIKNIETRWAKEWYWQVLINNPWVYWTLYNMWNNPKKKPNYHPKIWWSVIKVWGENYSYGALSMWLYWYFKIFGI